MPNRRRRFGFRRRSGNRDSGSSAKQPRVGPKVFFGCVIPLLIAGLVVVNSCPDDNPTPRIAKRASKKKSVDPKKGSKGKASPKAGLPPTSPPSSPPVSIPESEQGPSYTPGMTHRPCGVGGDPVLKGNQGTPKEAIAKFKRSVADVLMSGTRGTGFLVRHNWVATNYHVVERQGGRPGYERNATLEFRIAGQDVRRKGAVRYVNSANDIALIEVLGAPVGAPPLLLASMRTVELGGLAVVIGTPHDDRLPRSVTSGSISGVRPEGVVKPGVPEIQIDAPVNKGNSGGPLFDACGRVIGVVTWMFRRDDDDVAVEGLNFARPSDLLYELLQEAGL